VCICICKYVNISPLTHTHTCTCVCICICIRIYFKIGPLSSRLLFWARVNDSNVFSKSRRALRTKVLSPQHTAPRCNTLHHAATHLSRSPNPREPYVQRYSHCNTLQHTEPRCNTLHHAATHCDTLQRVATHRTCPESRRAQTTKVLCAAACCSVLRCVAVCCGVCCGVRCE